MPLYKNPGNVLPIDGGDRSAQSHLDYLHKAANAIDMGWWFHNRLWNEETTGAISYAPQNDDSLNVVQTTVASMKVTVNLGAGFMLGVPFRKTSNTTIPDDIVAPVALPRIDTVGIDPVTGAVTIYEGTENASPTAPYPDTGIFKAAEIYLRVGSTAIYDSEHSTGGYIQNRSLLFYLPGETPHTSGLTVSGGDFIFDGTSGDITFPADGLSIQSNYGGQFKIDASDTNGYLNFRTGGTTDRLTLGKPGDPITLHGSSHDLVLSGDGETLLSSGPNDFKLKASDGGISMITSDTQRYFVDEDGLHTWSGSLGNILFQANGIQMAHDYAGRFDFKATDAAGAFGFIPANESLPTMIIAGTGVQFIGDTNTTIFYSTSPLIYNEGEDQLVINQSGATDGIMIQTASEDRYRINEAGQHDFWGDAYFHDDVYILGTLYIDGVPVTGDDLGGSSGYATITLPGTVFEPAASGGSGGAASAEFGSNVLLFQSFLNAADGYCMAPNVLMPLNYNDTQTVHVRVRWSANSTSANQVRFLAYTAPQGEGDAANQTLNTAVAILDSNGTTANIMHVSDWAALPVTSIAAGDAFALRLDRTPSHTDDTLAADVRVHSVDIRYTRGAT